MTSLYKGGVMKRDLDYLKSLLEAFEESEDGVKINKIKGFDFESALFRYHMELLKEAKLICRDDGEFDIGLRKSGDGIYTWNIWSLRLTNDGHDFLDNIRSEEIWSTLKTGFKDVSLGVLTKVAKELFNRALNKQLGKIFD